MSKHRRATTRMRGLRVSVSSILASAATIGFGVVVAVSGTSGTFAYLSTQAQVGSATVTAGSTSLTVAYGSGTASSAGTIPATAWSTMLPGDVVSQEITVANPGNAKLAVTDHLYAAISYYEVRDALGTCATATIPTTALGTSAVTLTTLAAGASAVVCVQVKLLTSAPSNLQPASASPITPAPFKVVFDGTQVP
jgi:hypothetical protein